MHCVERVWPPRLHSSRADVAFNFQYPRYLRRSLSRGRGRPTRSCIRPEFYPHPRPGDGNLYIALGEGGASNDAGTGHIESGGNGQNLTTLLGKMLRIHIDEDRTGTYSIPADNPFVGSPTARQETFCSGLRNPFRDRF